MPENNLFERDMGHYERVLYDEYAETYDEGLKELLGMEDIGKFAEYKVQLLSLLCHSKVGGGKILDFGCGTGRSLLYLKKYFPENSMLFYGCDVSRESLKVAQKNVPDAKLFLNGSIESFANCAETFDIVMLACVLHHIDPEERQSWVRAIINKMNCGGRLAVFEHNLLNPFTRKIVNKPENCADNVTWMLKMDEIEELLLYGNSVKTIWKGYTLFSPFRPPYMTSLERLLKWLPIGAQQCIVIEKI